MEKMLEERRPQEEEYFRQRERSLLERMHQRAAIEAELEGIRSAAGVADDDIAQAVRELGYQPEAVPLLYLAPLVQVAWADGRLTARERQYIEAAARARGIEAGSAAHQQLVQWLEAAPSDGCFRRTLQVLRRLLYALPAVERAAGEREVLVSCYGVAGASRGLLGLGPRLSAAERSLLETIEAELAPALPVMPSHALA